MTRPAPWNVDDHGRVAAATQVASPNQDDRPPGTAIDLVVIHNISLPPGEFGGPGIADLFTNRLDAQAHPYFREIAGVQVSSHFLVRRDGELVQFVPCSRRAWHAGRSQWRGRERCNDFSIGIELEGTDDTAFEDVQYETLRRLAIVLRGAYPIAGYAGHSDIALPAGRKTDPGPHFDWARFHRLLDRA